MLQYNNFVARGKWILLDIVGDVLYFPLWWYSAGLVRMAKNRYKAIADTADYLALRLLILNIFKPMFAQYDRAGRIISFFIRIVILIGRLIYFAIVFAFELLMLLLWILVPIFVFGRLVSIYTNGSLY